MRKTIVYERVTEIGGLLRGDVEIARLALAKYVDRLVLTPKSSPEGPLLEISGDIEIFNGNEQEEGYASVMVARDGFAQHYTPLDISLNGFVLYPAV